MKDIMENWRGYIAEQEQQNSAPRGVTTFEELANLLKSIELKRKGGVAGKKLLRYAASLMPGGSAAMELYDDVKDATEFLKSLYTADDNFKTQAGLDGLNVNDDVSKIVDDQIEAVFLQYLPQLIADRTGPLGDFNVTKELQDFLASKFSNTTVKK